MYQVLSCVWVFATLWTVTCQAPLSTGFSRQEHWSGLPCPPPGSSVQSRSVQLLSYVWLWTAAHQPSLSIINSQSFLKLLSIKSVMPSNHLILCHPLLLLPSVFPSIGVFSSESVLHIRWPKYWSFSFSISSSSEYSGLISFRVDWFDLFAVQGPGSSLTQNPKILQRP